MEVVIITNIITSYREGFYDRLFKRGEVSVTVYCQDKIPGTNLKSIHKKYPKRVQIINAWIAKNEKIGFQFLPFIEIFRKADVIFLDGNPRILSNWIMSMLSFWFNRKKNVMWTMAHSFGANRFTESIRLKWTSWHKNIFVYTDKEVETLRKNGWLKQHIIGMNNGLDQRMIDCEKSKWTTEKLNHWKLSNKLNDSVVLLSIARLIPKNKFEYIINALPIIVSKIPNIKWVLVGSGSEEDNLKNLTKEKGLLDYVNFEGAIYREEELAPYFLSADLFVHPSSIGLSIMHAFGYGLPVIVDGDEPNHGPEYGTFVNLETGMNYEVGNVKNLAEVILKLLDSPNDISRMRKNVVKIAREKYNVDIMVDRFVTMCNTSV